MRLTSLRCNGIKHGYWSAAKKEDLVQRLAAYENTGLEPEEVKHVKHGHWVQGLWGAMCSECGDQLEDRIHLRARGMLKDYDVSDSECFEYVDIVGPFPEYCPHCGAKMDEAKT